MPFVGGFGVYRQIIADIAAAGYKGFDVVAPRSITPSR
jgi:cyclohexanone monooxygenase